MKRKLGGVSAVLCLAAIAVIWSAPARTQMTEVKEKPPMYTYVADWTIPRAQWGDMEKFTASNQGTMEKAMASGAVVGYGDDTNLIHRPDGETHDNWWSSMSMAGILTVLEQAYKSGTATNPVYTAATRHSDEIFVSRYYNWHSGSWKNAYTHVGEYKLKPDAPDDALETLSKNLFVPLLEKMLAAGAIHEYEIDTRSVHTEAPGTFFIVYIAANGEGLDKVDAAVRDSMKSNPLGGPAFGSMVDFSAHRDELARTNATFK